MQSIKAIIGHDRRRAGVIFVKKQRSSYNKGVAA
jgi:hypothetical protein